MKKEREREREREREGGGGREREKEIPTRQIYIEKKGLTDTRMIS